MWVCDSRKSRPETPWRITAPAEWATAAVPSPPRVTVSVVLEPAVTVTTSSLEVSGSTMSVYGKLDGKPLMDTTINEVLDCPGDCAGIADCSDVSTAVEEKYRAGEPGSPAAIFYLSLIMGTDGVLMALIARHFI